MSRGSRVRVMRGTEKVYDGKSTCRVSFSHGMFADDRTGTVSSLKNVKKDVQEMRKGTECGLGFDGWEEFEDGDQVQTYEEKVEKRTLQI